jgi:hypothetical protein
LVSKANELHASPNRLDNESADIKAASETLYRLSYDLEASFVATGPEERELCELAAQCKKLATQLLEVIASNVATVASLDFDVN